MANLSIKAIAGLGTVGGVLILVLVVALSSIRMIGTGEVGVVTRFGKVTGRELGEGIHLVSPFGVEQVSVYDIKIQKEQESASSSSKDLQDVNSVLTLNYRLNADKIGDIHQNVGKDFTDKLIEPAVQEVFKASSAQFSAQELITNRTEVKDTAQKLLTDRLEVHGITVVDLSIVDFTFSPAFTQSIEDKQIAQQNAERAKFNLDASKTDAEAQKAQAETLSQEFLQKLAIDKWNGDMPQYLGGGAVFNIPLQ